MQVLIYRLLCRGFDPEGTFLFSESKYLFPGELDGGRKNGWFFPAVKSLPTVRTIGEKKRREEMKRQR